MAIPVTCRVADLEPSITESLSCLADAAAITAEVSRNSWIFSNQSGAASQTAAGVGAGTYFPIGMTLNHLIELYWRVKELTMNVAYGAASESGTAIIQRGSADATIEADLMLPCEWSGTLPSLGGVYIFSSTEDINGDYKRVVFHDDKYWPCVYAVIIGDNFASTNRDQAEQFLPGGATLETMTDAFSLTMSDGTEYLAPIYGPDTGVSLELTCSEYWPHAKADGSAKFDTTTGAKL